MPQSTGLVLAGGGSRRMGADKRIVPIDGEPMLRRVARLVAESTDELLVAESAEHPLPAAILDGLDARVVRDRLTDAGPLAGLEAGLREASHELVVVVAADMPWIEPRLLGTLLDRLAASDADAVAAATDQGPQPLLAAYRRVPAQAAATRLLDAGERRLRALLDELRVEAVEVPPRAAANLNEPADLVAPGR